MIVRDTFFEEHKVTFFGMFVLFLLLLIILLSGSLNVSFSNSITDNSSDDTLNIGLLFSATGSSANVERAMINAAKMAFDEINATGGVNGKMIQYIEADYSSTPSLAEKKISDLITKNNVIATIGCYSSASRQAVIPVLEKYDSLLVYPTYTEGEEVNSHIIYTGAMPNQQAVRYLPWLMENCGKKVYLIGSDYVFPITCNKQAKKIIEENGGTIVGEVYAQTGETEFEEIISDIMKEDPDFIYCDLVGDSVVAFYRTYYSMGYRAEDCPIASITTDEMTVKQMGNECAEGHYASMGYFSSLETDASRKFVEKYRQYVSDDSTITSLAESTYDSCYLLAEALERSENPYDTTSLINAFSGLEFAAPQGRIYVDATNHCTWLYSRFAVIHNGEFDIVYSSDEAIRPEPWSQLLYSDGEAPVLQSSAYYDLYLSILFLLPVIFFVVMFSEKKRTHFVVIPLLLVPFWVNPTTGWANLVPVVAVLIWLAAHKMVRQQIQNGRLPFFAPHVTQAFFILLYTFLNEQLIHILTPLNRYYPVYAYSVLPDNLIGANEVFFLSVTTLIFLIYNIFSEIPQIRRMFGKESYGWQYYNDFLAFLILIIGIAVAGSQTDSTSGAMLSFSFQINSYQSTIGSWQLLLLKEIVVFLVGDIVIQFLESHLCQEQQALEKEGIQKSVFESSRDMIWCVSGINGQIITSNEAAREFFLMKKEDWADGSFMELFQGEELDIWQDYFEKALKTDDFQTEYFEPYQKKYFQMKIHRINMGRMGYDVAVFAEDITDAVEMDDKIRQINSELENKVIEKTRELQKSYEELENVSYMIAHEFKAPIRAISLYNEIIREDQEEKMTKDAKDAVEKIAFYSSKTLELTKKFLDYSKSKSSHLTLERVDMNYLIRDLQEEFSGMYPKRRMEWDVDVLPIVMADETLLRSCVYNILSNSIKFSSHRKITHIGIYWERDSQYDIFRFSDNGVGFAPESVDKLFVMFGRLHKDSEFHGNGIGLVTVKNIVERHGGFVSAEGVPDGGCTITVGLPRG